MTVRDIETVFDDMSVEKEDNDPGSIIAPSYATALGINTLRHYLQNSDIASSTMMHFNALKKVVVQTA